MMILKVEPGSNGSETARLRTVSRGASANVFGLKVGRMATASAIAVKRYDFMLQWLPSWICDPTQVSAAALRGSTLHRRPSTEPLTRLSAPKSIQSREHAGQTRRAKVLDSPARHLHCG